MVALFKIPGAISGNLCYINMFSLVYVTLKVCLQTGCIISLWPGDRNPSREGLSGLIYLFIVQASPADTNQILVIHPLKSEPAHSV